MNAGVVAALIAAIASVVVAVTTAVLSYVSERSRRVIQDNVIADQRAHDLRLAAIDNHLAERRAEQDARRDYEYAARRRLYDTVAPLLFQLGELSEGALGRIRGLARTAAKGDLGPGKESWLSHEGYYFKSTLYRLLAPLAIGNLMRRQLTVIDLTLDQGMATQYELIRQLAAALTDDQDFAAYGKSIDYAPDDSPSGHGDEERLPDRLRRQGAYSGWLEQALDGMIRFDVGIDAPRLINYGEFETIYEGDGDEAQSFMQLCYLFRDFHPGRHRVLWRVLVTHSLLYQAVVDIQRAGSEPGLDASVRPIRQPTEREQAALDWRPDDSDISDEEAVSEPLTVARRYLGRELPHLTPAGWSSTAPPTGADGM